MKSEKRFEAAKKRYESEFTQILVDTPELAKEHGVPIGTLVNMRNFPEFSCNIKDQLDDFMYKEYLRCGGYLEDH